MTTTEYLQKIKARCQELLAIASCAGPAEAGWRYSLGEAERLIKLIDSAAKNAEHASLFMWERQAERLTAAWPAELL